MADDSLVQIYVLDTSVFVNPDSYRAFAASKEKAVERFVALLDSCPKARIDHLAFFMPPSILEETLHFIPSAEILARYVLVKEADPLKVCFSGALLRDYIKDMRARINRSLRNAEEHLDKAYELEPSKDKAERGKALAPIINSLREKHRTLLREGTIDSAADVDLLLLAKELKAILVTADEGLAEYASKAGVTYISPKAFFERIESFCK